MKYTKKPIKFLAALPNSPVLLMLQKALMKKLGELFFHSPGGAVES